ncbi:glycosyltransferase family 4 protein [Actinomadura oligospora]|uniref:glycosyltransferase family 4 protein n=1 Tax=Actinomadura oligospora TaxID=111804 RepID=UPI00047D0CAA|nr:glycosyltransferase family 4 protein [Actinomadura oligospora]
MKLTYVLFNAFGIGGTVRTVINQANGMVARGHDVEIVSLMRYWEDTPFPLDERVRIIPMVDSSSGEHVDWDGFDGEEDTSWHASFPAGVSEKAEQRRRLNALIRYLPTIEDRIVVTTKPSIDLFVERYTDPSLIRIVQEHTNFDYHNAEWRKAYHGVLTQMDALVTLTESDRVAYSAEFPDLRVEQIPNALHALDVPRSDLSRTQVVSAGRLDGNKGFDMLIQAFAKVVETHPDWTLRIHGDGPEEARLRKLILAEHLYNHVFLMGATNSLDDELAKGSVFAMSSKSEGFGMVLLEAMNCGLPVVSFSCPVGPRELVNDGVDGFLVPERDVEALAEGIIRLIEDEGLRRDFSEAALKKAAEYGPDPIADSWEQLFESLGGGAE